MSTAEPPREGRRAPVRVVLADDQRLVRESLGTLLGLLDGIELVASAADGEEAVALAAEHEPEVVLMDLRMPRKDGIEATRQLRERQPEVRVIALTTYADEESVLGALRAGARGYDRDTTALTNSATAYRDPEAVASASPAKASAPAPPGPTQRRRGRPRWRRVRHADARSTARAGTRAQLPR
jgi:DNA-binding NarL/FixJ family response regulator